MTTTPPGWNPYIELGLSRGADNNAITAAARDHARRHHPDNKKGGNAETFARGRLAKEILFDKARRKVFDETGRIPPKDVDVSREAALGVIQHHMAAAFNGFMNDPKSLDPRKLDLIDAVRFNLNAEVDEARKGIETGKQQAEFLRDCKGRFSRKVPGEPGVTDPIDAGFDINIKRIEDEVDRLREGIKVRNIAVMILGEYAYRFETTMMMGGERSALATADRTEP